MAGTLPTPVAARPRGFSRRSSVDPAVRVSQLADDRAPLQRVALLARDNWVKKELRPHCYFCERKFRPFSRRHHCRACGDVVCSNCNRRRDVEIDSAAGVTTFTVRLCFDCIDKATIAQQHAPPGYSASGSHHDRSACSSHMKYADSLIDSIKSGGTSSDSLAHLELSASAYDNDRDDEDPGTATDHDGYETDDTACDDPAYMHADATKPRDADAWHGGNSTASTGSTTSTASTASTASSGGSARERLAFLPEDRESVEPDGFASELTRAMADADDRHRAELLRTYNVLGVTSRQREYDALCDLLCRALHCGVAAVAFLKRDTQWYRAKVGISQSELPRAVAFCPRIEHAAEHTSDASASSPTTTIVLDATSDPRFRRNPLVTGAAHIRFYASAPIRDPVTKLVLGSVFVMDPRPKGDAPARAREVLAYAATAAERLLLLGRKDHRQRLGCKDHQRARRVFSEPEPVDVQASAASAKAEVRAGSMLLPVAEMGDTTDEAEDTTSTFRSEGLTLLDDEQLRATLPSTSSMRRRTTSRETGARLERLHPRHSAGAKPSTLAASTPAPTGGTVCKDLLQQISSTQELLASLGRRRGASTAKHAPSSAASTSSARATMSHHWTRTEVEV